MDGAPSALLSLIPSAVASYSPASAMESCLASPSGMTYEPSTARDGAVTSTSSAGDFPVRTSVSPAVATALTANEAASGWRWPGSFVKYDSHSRTWKTRQLLLLGGSVEFSESWPRWGSMRNGECSERTMLALHISENAFGFLLPTPTASEYGTRNNGKRGDGSVFATAGAPSLSTMARKNQWPTPRSSDGTHGGRITPRKSREGGNIIEAVSARTIWPTPTANDSRGSGSRNTKSSKAHFGLSLTDAVRGDGGRVRARRSLFATPLSRDHRSGLVSQETLDRNSRPLNEQIGGPLNPTWVEWLMGWPIGWTDCAPLEMVKFQQWLRSHGGV